MSNRSGTREKILVLGAGIYQVPLIKAAQRLGHEALVVSVQGSYPGKDLADEFFPIDTTDIEAITRLAREQNIAAVVTSGTDLAVPAIGAVVDELGLKGCGYQAALKSMHKTSMKKAFKEFGVLTAEFKIVTALRDAESALASVGFPAMVKATDSSGSRGVTRIDSLTELKSAWQEAVENSRMEHPEIIIETCLSGIEFGAQAVVSGNEVTSVFFHNDTVTPPPRCTPIGHSMPANLDEATISKTEKLVQQAVRALAIRDTIANVDLMLVDNEPYIIEIGARIGATCIPENISYYTGIDLYEYIVRLALGEKPGLFPVKTQANAAVLLTSEEAGIMKDVFIPDTVAQHPDLLEISIDVKPGDPVQKFRIGPDRIGHIIVKSNSALAAEQLALELARQVKFIVG